MQIHNDEQFSFYVIEGVDGAGKSTLGQLLSSKIGGIHYETPSKIFKPSQPLIDQSASVNAQFLFYLSANAQASNDITTMRANQPVVCVRYIYSTIAYHVAKGLELDWAISLINSTNLVLPSKVFLLVQGG
jgi:thymidylate kinase